MRTAGPLCLERSALSYAFQSSSKHHCSNNLPFIRHVICTRRALHSSSPKDAAIPVPHSTSPGPPDPPPRIDTNIVPLDNLPLSQILRTYFITSISSSPTVLGATSSLLHRMLESRNPLFRIDSNPALRAILWETFYKQFCAGETAAQISDTCDKLRQQGYAGVVLEYALEVLKDAESNELEDIALWRQGMIDTIDMAAAGDFVALKWSGMGAAAMRRMKHEQTPSAEMSEAMHAVCELAAKRNIGLLPAAEETWSLNGFHSWCLDLQRVYNLRGTSVVYTTYQAYLKQTPATLAHHLALAQRDGFTLGIKLVRGAYLASEQRDLIYPTIEGTHHAFDSLMSAILLRKYNDVLRPAHSSSTAEPRLPDVNFVIASHNAASVEKALDIRRQQVARGERLTPTVFSQLQGMADEVSCSLIAASKADSQQGAGASAPERVLKYTTWGTMHQCLNYLLRRAAENQDAAGRTLESRAAMRVELVRRIKGALGASS